MEDKLLRYTLRVDRYLFKKFRYVAEFESKYGKIEIDDKDE